MEYYGANSAMQRIDPVSDWNLQPESSLEEAMRQMSMQSHDMLQRGSGPYPERPGESDCAYYMRNGVCGFGMNCRFNHPPNINLGAPAARNKGEEYPERPGQPECQYFLKTGSCKFGATCKYHHPRYKVGMENQVALNVLGYPLNPNEKECSFYVRTGQCKYGTSCKFHHPQPLGASVTIPGSPFYPSVPALPIPGPQPYAGGLPAWQISRTPIMSSSYLQGPSGYVPLMLSQGMVSVPGWSSYPVEQGTITSSDGLHPGSGTGLFYGPRHQMDSMNTSMPGIFSSYSSRPVATWFPSISTQAEHVFPERPGQPECQFYMRTGSCRFGSTCKYHHPRDRHLLTNCALNPMGLPSRPGVPTCSYYAQRGICKYGPTCKYDHPLGTLSYSPSASSLTDMPVAPYPVGFSSATLAPSSSSSDLRPEAAAGSSKEPISTSQAAPLSSTGEVLGSGAPVTTLSSSAGSTFSGIDQK
ncbi:zinc finger CCCH domain-containing protein ZFN-like isoform X1 [Cryptomeria japonica]|uniref:zinc finger CCCH domain-containing protein ZFN-like isoform X1 n=1 Tax=Cryptomeria japonica TaxID=3369 RepID=UPI0027D9EFD4|nr:zinc finger CCCH domain-containing protein ZFN-like isoform X1 [Cryptomeria japonica]